MRDPHDRPAPGTIEARNFDDDNVPGPTEQSELEMLREFEADVRRARRSACNAYDFMEQVSDSLERFDRKRGR